MKYELTDAQIANVQKAFTYHQTKEDQSGRYEELRSTAALVALGIMQYTPVCREQSLALTKLEECNMWVNAAIARNE